MGLETRYKGYLRVRGGSRINGRVRFGEVGSLLDTLCCAGGMGGMAPAPIQMAGGGGSRGRLEIYSDIHSSKFY